MYLIDTNVVSETRKKERANPGVLRFFDRIAASGEPIFVSFPSENFVVASNSSAIAAMQIRQSG